MSRATDLGYYDPDETSMSDLLPADTLAYLADEPIDVHTWFELSYCNYAVLNRALLQSMPIDWQHRFTTLMRELETVVRAADVKVADRFEVRCRGEGGRYVADPVPQYNRGREIIDLRRRSS